MAINGRERLACKTLIKDVAEKEGATVKVEPLRNLPVQRDLIVDPSAFLQNYRKVKPYQINPGTVHEKERIQSPEERERFECTRVCPRHIKVTKLINFTKGKITAFKKAKYCFASFLQCRFDSDQVFHVLQILGQIPPPVLECGVIRPHHG